MIKQGPNKALSTIRLLMNFPTEQEMSAVIKLKSASITKPVSFL